MDEKEIRCNECGEVFPDGGELECPFCDSDDLDFEYEEIEQLPYANTIKGYIEALELMSRYAKNGPDTSFFLDAQHDVLYTYLTTEQLSLSSNDGKKLQALGWWVEDGSWAKYT